MKPVPPAEGVIRTVDKDGVSHEFPFTCEEDSHEGDNAYDRLVMWAFRIQLENDLFQYELVDENSRMRVQMMTRNDCDRYLAKGIPEAFIRLSFEIFRLPIVSSKNEVRRSPFNPLLEEFTEQHSPDADRVWKRLVSGGEAYFDESEGRYCHPRPKSEPDSQN